MLIKTLKKNLASDKKNHQFGDFFNFNIANTQNLLYIKLKEISALKFTTKKPLYLKENLYKNLIEFNDKIRFMKEYCKVDKINFVEARIVNVPAKNTDNFGTIKIMFHSMRNGHLIDLDGNKFSSLPKDWSIISYKGREYIDEIVKFRLEHYLYPLTFFPSDTRMQKLCKKCGINDAEKKFSHLLTCNIYQDFLVLERYQNTNGYIPFKYWKKFERTCQKQYNNAIKLVSKYAETYAQTGQPQKCNLLYKEGDSITSTMIRVLQEYNY